ncbi:MAG: FtsX-like permease family protein [Chlamydiales bacterium]|nr:FtsX-like permease family protein [Chlamydiales bacterium]
MYELSVARKYLLPRWRQLSVSVISLISILVIALVVWLIVVFFSVTNGLEKYWVGKFVTLAAPVRITPTDAYYRSYFYQVDSISEGSDYQFKSIAEKLAAGDSDPYDPTMDEEIPSQWPVADRLPEGQLKDPVKEALAAIHEIPGAIATNYETTFGNIRLRLARGASHRVRNFRGEEGDQAFLAQATLVGSLEAENPYLGGSLLPLSGADMTNIAAMAATSATNVQADSAHGLESFDPAIAQKRLADLFENVTITKLTPAPEGWIVPRNLLPKVGGFQAVAIMRGERVVQLVVPSQTKELPTLLQDLQKAGYQARQAQVILNGTDITVTSEDKNFALPPSAPITLPRGIVLSATLMKDSLKHVTNVEEAIFDVQVPIQGLVLSGQTPMSGLEVADFRTQQLFDAPTPGAHWIYRTAQGYQMPSDSAVGEGVLLPKNFRDVGILAGDRGYISYFTPTPSSVQEQRVPVYVTGFYDPGMIPMGGKLIFVDRKLTSMMRAAYGQQDKDNGNGIRVRFEDSSRAQDVKSQLAKAFQERGIDRYWKIETYHDYEFAKEILQQQKSDKNLFMVIAAVIIVVACSNIISMLIILVNDKKVEIGILRSMGATSMSIALVFGTCGFVMGALGSLLGMVTATATLYHLDSLIAFIGHLQGHEMFNPTFYGQSMPNELSFEALTFVFGVTATFSLMAGIVPAIKASLLKPSAILRSE